MKLLVTALLALGLLTGCMTVSGKVSEETGRYVVDSGSSNWLRPSISVVEVQKCEGTWVESQTYKRTESDQYGAITEYFETIPIHCAGDLIPVAAVQASQPGFAPGAFGSAVQAGALAYGLHKVGEGIGDSGDSNRTNVNQSNKQKGGGAKAISNSKGGNAVSSSSSKARSYSNANARASQFQGQLQGQTQHLNNRNYNRNLNTNINNPAMMGMD